MKKLLVILVLAGACLLPINLKAQDSWTKKADFGGIARTNAVGFSIGSKGYIVTGEQYNGSYICNKDMWEYDPATEVWSQKADFGGVGRYMAVGFSIGSKGYVGWGLTNPFSYVNDFWEYDPTNNTWSKKADLGSTGSREGAVGFSIGTKGYVGTGCNHNISYGYRLKDFWEYNPNEDKWTRKADLSGAGRAHAVGFSIATKGYIGTGFTATTTLKDFWEYNPIDNVWTEKADFGGGNRLGAFCFTIGSKAYLGAGFTQAWANARKDLWEYSAQNNTWTQKTDFGGTARIYAVGFSIGGKGYVGTGVIGETHYKDFWEFEPICIIGNARAVAGPSSVCPDGQAVVYTVASIPNATGYVWSYSGTGATISGTGNSVSISFGETATSGTLSVYGTSSCGDGGTSPDFAITVGQNNWIRKADFSGIKRWSSVGFSIGNKGYMVTGAKYDNGNYICNKDLWEYDPATGVWSQKADFGGAGRLGAVGFSIGSKGYVGFGLTSPFNYIDDFWEYDPATNTWLQRTSIGSSGSREGAIGFSIGNKGYVGTGCNHQLGYGKRLQDFWEYDPAVDAWTRKADFGGEARASAVGFSIGSKGYVGTGSGSLFLKDFWEYDQATNVWNQKADFGGTARQSATGFSIGNYGYIGTGVYGDVNPVNSGDFWEYSAETDKWSQKPDLGGAARSGATGFSIGIKGYIGCGNTSAQGQSNDFWEYNQGCIKELSKVDELTNDVGWMQFSLFPNPNPGQFGIKLKTNTLEVFDIEIYNSIGRRIDKIESVSVEGTSIIDEDLQHAASGMYTIVFLNKDKSQKVATSKFIVIK